MRSLRAGAFAFAAVRSVIFKPPNRWGVVNFASTTFVDNHTDKFAATVLENDEAAHSDPLNSETYNPKTSVEPGTIYFVSTPIGNLDDISVRAMKVLQSVNYIAAEDTRRTGLLLHLLGIETSAVIEKRGGSGKGPILLSHHQHNFKQKIPSILDHAHNGQSIAVVSDAGTPGIADPGMELAAACVKSGVPLVPVPGACAAIAAISVSGFSASEFVFFGFLPRKGSELRRKLEEINTEDRTCIFYEAPHRIVKTIKLLSKYNGNRPILIAREITKLHEELFRGSVLEASEWAMKQDPRGEFTIVLSANQDKETSRSPEDKVVQEQEILMQALDEVDQLLAESSSGGKPWTMSMAVQQVAKDRKIPKRLLYKLSVDRLKP